MAVTIFWPSFIIALRLSLYHHHKCYVLNHHIRHTFCQSRHRSTSTRDTCLCIFFTNQKKGYSETYTTCVLKLLQFFLEHNNFLFNYTTYQQVVSTAMGSCVCRHMPNYFWVSGRTWLCLWMKCKNTFFFALGKVHRRLVHTMDWQHSGVCGSTWLQYYVLHQRNPKWFK